MGTWMRELAGWIILGLGLLAIYQVYVFLLNRWFIEGGILATSTFLLMRTGTHLLKVASAARAAGRPVRAPAKPVVRSRTISPTATPTGRPRTSVVPGPATKG